MPLYGKCLQTISFLSQEIQNGLPLVLEKTGGSPYAIGESISVKDRSGVLQAIARGGEKVFYHGKVARSIIKKVKQFGGPLTMKDLADYQVKIRKPLVGNFGPYRVGDYASS